MLCHILTHSLSMSLIISLFLLSLGSSSSSASPVGSRSILGDINHLPDYAVDLNVTNFDQVLRDTPAIYAVVEFYAHWCPACRNYKPHYEKVAKLFNGADAVHPGIILMTRVDCAQKVNTNLCDRFSVSHYPMLFWGPPSKFVSGEKSEIHSIDDGRTADRLLNWINKKVESTFGLDDQRVENEHLRSNAFDIILRLKMIKSDTPSWFSEFWTSWVLSFISFSRPTTNGEEK